MFSSRLVLIVVTVWFIIVGGLLLRPGREPICIVCGNPSLDLAIKAITLVAAIVGLVAALRLPAIEVKAPQVR